MQTSYTGNYIRTYVVQTLSIIVGFVSLLIVIPAISTNKPIYGVYAICTSIVVFLSYADIGFLTAGAKYAAEYFAKGEKKREMEVVGFSCAVLLSIVFIIFVSFAFLSFNPELLISQLSVEQKNVASRLLLILACSTPVLGLLRVTQVIYSIRVIDYEFQFVQLIANLIKIASIYYFFRHGNYNVVGYFLFVQGMNLIVLIVSWYLLKRKHNYKLSEFLKTIRFSKDIFNEVKSLAFSSLFITITWVLFYELDSIAIGKIYNAEAVALYAIGFNILSLIRSVLGAFYSPFSARFNHFIGLGLEGELKEFIINIMIISLPIVLFFLYPLYILSEPLVVAWVGVDYLDAVPMVGLLVLCNIMAFVNYPMGMVLVAKKEINALYISNALLPVIFWLGILLFGSILGVYSFALFKLVAFLFSSLYYIFLLNKVFAISLRTFIKRIIIPFIPSFLLVSVILVLLKDVTVAEKSVVNLMKVGLMEVFTMGVGVSVSIMFVPTLRNYISTRIIPLFKKK